MPAYKLIIEVLKNGEPFMKGDVGACAEFFKMDNCNIQRRAAVGGNIWMGQDKYMLRYTGEKLPRSNPHDKPKKKPKSKMTIAKVNAMAKKAGMTYGNYVARMERGM